MQEIVWKGRTVHIAFDSDVAGNEDSQRAEAELTKAVEKLGANVGIMRIPPRADGGKQGADDYLASHEPSQRKRAWNNLVKKAPKADNDALPQPWPHKVDGAELLAEVEGFITG